MARRGHTITTMNANTILLSLVGFVLSGLVAILVAYFSVWAFGVMVRPINYIDELKKKNVGMGILMASVLVANGLILKQVLFPFLSCIRSSMQQGLSTTEIAKVIGYGVGYIALAQCAAMGSLFVGMSLFARLTRGINELEEIRANNIAVAVTHSAVIIVIGLFLADGLSGLLAAFVPSPSFDSIRTFGK